jgi:redox-sensing transcriptional repressor
VTECDIARVPEGVIERLPAYLGVLLQLRGEGRSTVSSALLGGLTEINPAQIRRDLTHFGSFGRRGVGYDVVTLIDRIQHILGSDHAHRIVLVGAGRLGSAVAAYDGLSKHGFLVSAIFDNDLDKVGRRARARSCC